MVNKDIIGLDVGQKHTGMARASTAARIAEPLKTVETAKLFDELNGMNIEAIVIGLPRNLNGEDTAQTRWVRQWAAKAKVELKAPMFWIDEALTSKKSANLNNEHAVAATTILQDFLETPESERLVC